MADEGMDYGNPGEHMAQEFAMYMKSTLRSIVHEAYNAERTIPQIVADMIMTVIQLPFAILYALMTYNETFASMFKFFYMMFVWYLTVACIVFCYFLLENIYKSFFTARLALLGRLEPWRIITSVVGVRDTLQNDIKTEMTAKANNFSVNVIKVPMTGLMLQVVVACLLDLGIALIVSLAWPVTTFVFIVTTIFTCKAPKVFYEYTKIETNSTQAGNIHQSVALEKEKQMRTKKTNGFQEQEEKEEILKQDFQEEEEGEGEREEEEKVLKQDFQDFQEEEEPASELVLDTEFTDEEEEESERNK